MFSAFKKRAQKKRQNPEDCNLFATTIVRDPLSGDRARFHALVARYQGSGLWQVDSEAFFTGPAGGFVAYPHRPGKEKPEPVTADIAFERMMKFEDDNYSPGDGNTEILESALHCSEMKELAEQAKIAAAQKAGGRIMQMRKSRLKPRGN